MWRTEWARSVHPTPISSNANQLSADPSSAVVRSRPARRARRDGPVARRPRRTRPAFSAISRWVLPDSRPRSTPRDRSDRPPSISSRSSRAAFTAAGSGPSYRRRRARTPSGAGGGPAAAAASSTDSTASRAAHQPGPSSTRGSSSSTCTGPQPTPWRTSTSGSKEIRSHRVARRATPSVVKMPWYSSPTVTRGGEHDQGLPAGAFLGPEQLLELGQPTDQPDVEVGRSA